MNKADIGIIGGSGFYKFLDKGKWITVKTPYGRPSDQIFLTSYKGRKIAFLPRHGRGHKIPPHMINYRANIWALKKLEVKVIISPAAVGSLQPNIKRGDFVICDDFIDRTRGRKDSFFDGPKTFHVSSAYCYCEKLRKIAIETCKKNKIRVHPKGTAVIIQGPRFSSKAESKWFTKMGWEVITMTQYPEVVLAREAEICYLNISLITDYDAGLIGEKGVKPVSFDEIRRVFGQNIENVKKVILQIIGKIPKDYKCKQCHQALKGAAV
ncbi:MAG: S-methyl-5'-thioadenosine phosphorylase [Patescibacteria group bacterium]